MDLLGHRVRKVSGYTFEGWVLSQFQNSKGEWRVVVEHDDGWCFIFAISQVEKVP